MIKRLLLASIKIRIMLGKSQRRKGLLQRAEQATVRAMVRMAEAIPRIQSVANPIIILL
jgi:hypothetical protein